MNTFIESAELTLLRTELERIRERYAVASYEQQQALEILGRYLNTLFPAAYAQAMAQRTPVYTFAQEMLRALTLVQPMQTVTEEQPATQPPAPQVDAPPALRLTDADQISLLRLTGSTPAFEEVRRSWCAEVGQDDDAFKAQLDALISAQLATLETVKATGTWWSYYSPQLIALTDSGRAEYQQRFGLPPRGIDEFIDTSYKSRDDWYLIRVARAVILAGGSIPGARFIPAAVWDTAEPLPAPYQRRYGNSEPDLIVELVPPDGTKILIAVECERSNYSPPRLKTKVLKNMRDYAEHGFDGVYYIAPNRNAGGLLKTAIRKVAADLRNNPQSLERGFVALFALDSLLKRWLASPAMLDRWHGTPPDESSDAAAADYCFKHKNRGGSSDGI